MQRRETSAAIREAEAVLDNAASERQRRSVLLERGAISRSEYDTADREFRVAQARLDAVRERHALVEDEVRPEDIRRAEAELDRARAMRAEAQAMLAKTVVRSPIDGIVLRRHKKSGESVSTQDRQPILTLGDISHLRVRAEVDETDVSRVHEGQSVYVTAPAYGGRRFAGRVIRVGRILGRKKIFSDAPNERVDTKVLETLIELDSGHTLPAGLRVDTFIEAAAPRN
ncbi:MAG: efflux RND transporter periplasmic adaptor subunit [Bryobacteraceae bacterium]